MPSTLMHRSWLLLRNPKLMPEAKRVAVIGAGAGGLCAAKHLLSREIDVTVLEMGSCVGGLWVYENDNGLSPAYASLRINSEARITGFPDYPLPADSPLFPSHTEVRAYLEAYAEHFHVRPRIRFNTKVEAVQPTGDGHWTVLTKDGPLGTFDGVVAAPGHQSVPSHPPFRHDFTGEYLHAHDYRVPDSYRGKRTLIIGTGNSALDIAADICTVTAATTLVARSPVLIMPRLLFGVPVARILAKAEREWMPWPTRRALRVGLARVAHGPMERWGFVTPRTRTHPTSHPTVMTHIAYSRIAVRPGVSAVAGRSVLFVDGRREVYDAMIAATGYELDLPFISREIVPIKNRRVDLYKRIFPPDWAGLYLIGFFNASGGANIRMMDTQCRLLAAVVAGEIQLPDSQEMYNDIEAERQRLWKLYPARPRYGLELDPAAYQAEIDALLSSTKTGSGQSSVVLAEVTRLSSRAHRRMRGPVIKATGVRGKPRVDSGRRRRRPESGASE